MAPTAIPIRPLGNPSLSMTRGLRQEGTPPAGREGSQMVISPPAGGSVRTQPASTAMIAHVVTTASQRQLRRAAPATSRSRRPSAPQATHGSIPAPHDLARQAGHREHAATATASARGSQMVQGRRTQPDRAGQLSLMPPVAGTRNASARVIGT